MTECNSLRFVDHVVAVDGLPKQDGKKNKKKHILNFESAVHQDNSLVKSTYLYPGSAGDVFAVTL